MKKWLLCIALCTGKIYTMNEFKHITKCLDATQFAGKVVAYKTTSNYFGSYQGYSLLNPSTKYGYIEEDLQYHPQERDSFYLLNQLLKSKEVPNRKCLLRSKLQNAHLYVRKITKQEAKSIIQLMKSEKAKFDYVLKDEDNFNEILKALESE